MILLTDAVVRVPGPMQARFNAWKVREQVRCISLVLASSTGQLAAVSDEVHLLRGLDVSENGIEKCLSI